MCTSCTSSLENEGGFNVEHQHFLVCSIYKFSFRPWKESFNPCIQYLQFDIRLHPREISKSTTTSDKPILVPSAVITSK